MGAGNQPAGSSYDLLIDFAPIIPTKAPRALSKIKSGSHLASAFYFTAFQPLELEASAELHLERLARIVIEQKFAQPR